MNFASNSLEAGAKASDLGIGGATDTTVTCWVRAESFDGGGVFEFGNTGSSFQDFALRTRAGTEGGGGDNVWTANHWDQDYTFTVTGSLNNWTFFAMTYDTAGTNTSAVYAGILDNDTEISLEASTSINLNIQDNVTLNIGQFSKDDFGLPNQFDGDIADLRIFNRVLSQDELNTMFLSKGKIQIVEGLQAYYDLHGPTGETAPSFFIASNSATTATTGSTSITVNVPGADGDLLLAVIACGGNSSGTPANLTIPGTWTHINVGQTDLPSTVSTPSVWILRRTASSEPASYTFTQNQTAVMIGSILSYRNVATTEDAISNINTGTSTVITSPSLATTNPVVCVRVFCCDDDEVLLLQDGPTQRLNVNQGGNDASAGNGITLAVSDHLMQLTPTNAYTGTMVSEEWGALTVTFETSAGFPSIEGHSVNQNFAEGRTAVGPVYIETPFRNYR